MNSVSQKDQPDLPWLDVLKVHVASLRFGSVQLVVHDSRVVQIEKSEKVRFDRPDQKLPTEAEVIERKS